MTLNVVPMDALMQRVEQLAPLPGVARRVIQVTDREDFSADDLSSVLATDAALTAKLLRLGNSAFYGYPRRITTVRDAVVLIGFRAVRSTAIATAIMDIFPGHEEGPFNIDLFWGHSVAAGVMGELLAKETRQAKPEDAFTAGVLHDIGRLVLNQYEPEAFGRAVWIAINDGVPLNVAEEQVFGYGHAELGAQLAQRWNFPEELCEAIAGHNDLDQGGPQQGLRMITAQANAICHQYGLWSGLDTADGARSHGESGGPPTPESAALRQTVEDRLGGVEGVRELVTAFLRSSRDRDPRWYSQPVGGADGTPAAAAEAASGEPDASQPAA